MPPFPVLIACLLSPSHLELMCPSLSFAQAMEKLKGTKDISKLSSVNLDSLMTRPSTVR